MCVFVYMFTIVLNPTTHACHTSGGASGGYTTGPQCVIDLLRQRSRPYVFSNSLSPVIVGATLEVFNLLTSPTIGTELLAKLQYNTSLFRSLIVQAGFEVKGVTEHPIIPIMLYDTPLAKRFAERLLDLGIYVIAFGYPIVPKNGARIRVQVSAAHTEEQIRRVVSGFEVVGRELGVIA